MRPKPGSKNYFRWIFDIGRRYGSNFHVIMSKTIWIVHRNVKFCWPAPSAQIWWGRLQFPILLRKHAARMKNWEKYLEKMEKSRPSVKNKAKAKLSGPKRNTTIQGGGAAEGRRSYLGVCPSSDDTFFNRAWDLSCICPLLPSFGTFFNV